MINKEIVDYNWRSENIEEVLNLEQEDIWTGSYYDLSIEFPLTINLQQLKEVLSTIEALQHFTFDILDDPIQVGEVVFIQGEIGEFPCMLSVMIVEEEATWLDFSIPVNLLETQYPVRYPLTLENNLWIRNIQDMYSSLAMSIYEKFPFHMAMIGEEVAGMTTSTLLDVPTLQTLSAILPLELQKKLDIESDGEPLSQQLRLYSV